jgi:hypothetical protein
MNALLLLSLGVELFTAARGRARMGDEGRHLVPLASAMPALYGEVMLELECGPHRLIGFPLRPLQACSVLIELCKGGPQALDMAAGHRPFEQIVEQGPLVVLLPVAMRQDAGGCRFDGASRGLALRVLARERAFRALQPGVPQGQQFLQ